MNSFIKYTPESLNDHKAFVELLLSIIDTKLQFVKHHTNVLISSLSESTVEAGSEPAYLPESYSEETIAEGEIMIDMIERYSKTTNRLLILRTKLSKHNVSLVYDLLNNNHYLEYDSKTLQRLLDDFYQA